VGICVGSWGEGRGDGGEFGGDSRRRRREEGGARANMRLI
jgi:hypothetical protein